ncbi:MAG: hypothetical protein EOP48_22810 [Sphingobacteriales bacterium]|nr:MAG: hypothetical protein EOP48_22810 [Sphingobacteriales bacterium]
MTVFIDWQNASKDTFVNSEGRISFLITSAFFTWLAVYSIVKGLQHRNKAKYFPKHYKGDAHLLAFMEREGIKQGTIRLWWEPFYVILIGILFTLFINAAGGIPIIACGLSVWFYEVIGALFFPDAEQKLKEHNDWKKERDNEDFYEIPQQ